MWSDPTEGPPIISDVPSLVILIEGISTTLNQHLSTNIFKDMFMAKNISALRIS